MAFRKLSKLEKWYLKLTNKKEYKDYKHQLHFHKATQTLPAAINHPYKAETSFKHSGNSGDIIYSLPAVFELAKNGKARFYFHTNQPATYDKVYHPLGNIMLNDKIVDMLRPLLLHQPQIASVKKLEGENIDYDLDGFRNYPILQDRGSIVRWYAYVYGISYNTSTPWLVAPHNEQYNDTIVIARSHRYRSPLVDYSFLKQYSNILFVGVEEEYEDIKKTLPDIQYKPVADFLELATIINSSKLFIGNQSFPFALAEGLKVKRLLEVYYKSPNVVVEGEGANDFMFQPQFEYAVKRLLRE